MKKGLIRALQILRWVTFIVLFVVSVLFLVYCITNSDRRLLPAIICVLGTSAMIIKEIWMTKQFGQQEGKRRGS